MFKSIKWRMTAIFFAVTAVFLFLLGLYLMNAMESYSYENVRFRLLSYARLMSDDLKDFMVKGASRDFFQDYARKAKSDINARVTIITPDGTVLGDSVLDQDSLVNHANRPEIKAAMEGKVGESVRYSTSLQERMYYFAVPVKSGTGVIGVVRAAIPWSEVEAGQNHIRISIGTAILVALILMVLVVTSFTSEMVAPLREMTAVAREMAEGRLDMTVKVETEDEIGALGKGLNYMVERLRDTIRQITEERNKVQAILTSMTDGVIAIDRDGHILLINPAVERMFNARYEQVVGKSVIEVVRNYDLERLLQSALQGFDGIIRELRIFAPDPKSFRISTAPLTNEHGVVGVVAVMRDITAFRQVEKMKTDFVANVSHELKTPLTSIKGFVETLLEGAINDPDTARHFLDIINDETDRLNRLINDLLSLSMIEAKQREAKMVPMDLESSILNTVAVLSHQAEERDLALSVEIESPLPPIEADEDMIGQLMINLLDNAIKYTPDGGRIRINAGVSGDRVRVAVSDTGIGIPAESIPRLFERFYRVDKARSREMGGTGLGLAIVKHILEVHNGSIEVESLLGQGSTFTFFLPVRNVQP